MTVGATQPSSASVPACERRQPWSWTHLSPDGQRMDNRAAIPLVPAYLYRTHGQHVVRSRADAEQPAHMDGAGQHGQVGSVRHAGYSGIGRLAGLADGACTDLPGRRMWSILAALPLVVPSYVYVYLHVTFLFPPRGCCNSCWNRRRGASGSRLRFSGRVRAPRSSPIPSHS